MECCGAWTPDGRYYVFRSLRDGVFEFVGRRREGRLVARSKSRSRATDFRADELLSAASQSQRKDHLCHRDAALRGTGPLRCEAKEDFVPVLAAGLSADHLEFSRDGQWIAYVTVPERTLWRARSDGSDAFQLTFPPLQVDSRPHWSTDGKRIVFAAKTSWRIDEALHGFGANRVTPKRSVLRKHTRKPRRIGCPARTH